MPRPLLYDNILLRIRARMAPQSNPNKYCKIKDYIYIFIPDIWAILLMQKENSGTL